MGYSFDDGGAPSTRLTQYFEILGNRAIYHDGWIASCFHGRVPWIRSQALPFGTATRRGSCTGIEDDFSQATDLAVEHPEKLAELQALFEVEARKHDVYPLSDQTTKRALPQNRPSHLEGVSRFTLYRGEQASARACRQST